MEHSVYQKAIISALFPLGKARNKVLISFILAHSQNYDEAACRKEQFALGQCGNN